MFRLCALAVMASWAVLGQAGPSGCFTVDQMDMTNENQQDNSDADDNLNLNEMSDPDDVDADGIADDEDNCPETANPTQGDLDEDGVGNACDNCPEDPNPDQANADGDLNGDVCDENPDVHDDELVDNENGNENDNGNDNINENDNENLNENSNENGNDNDNTSMEPEPVLMTYTIEPDDYDDETELTNINEHVLLNTADDDNSIFSLFDVTANTDGQGYAPTGEKVFGHANIPFFNNVRRLRMDFPSPAMEIEIMFGGGSSGDPEIGRLEAYDSMGNLLDEYITEPLGAGESEVMTISRSEADIFIAIAYIADGEGNFGRLDELIFTVWVVPDDEDP